MQIEVILENSEGKSKEVVLLKHDASQPAPKYPVHAGKKMTLIVDGITLTGAELIHQHKLKLTKVNQDLVIQSEDESEEILELTNFYTEQDVLLSGDQWFWGDNSQLKQLNEGVTHTSSEFAVAPLALINLMSLNSFALISGITAVGIAIDANQQTKQPSAPKLLLNSPTNIIFTPSGGTVVADTLNETTTAMDFAANITAGEATGGKAEFYVNGILIGTDYSISATDTRVTYSTNDGTPTSAEVQAAIVSGGLVSVKLYDAAGNTITSTGPTLIRDVSAPNPTLLSSGVLANTSNANVQSNEAGTAYLIRSDIAVNSLADITGAADSSINSVAITTADTVTSMSLAGLSDGQYVLYVVDTAGNLSAPTRNFLTLDSSAMQISANMLVTASAAGGASQSTTNSTFTNTSGNAVVFSNVNATSFGNAGAAFNDSGPSFVDYFYWSPITQAIQLITHSPTSTTSSIAQTDSAMVSYTVSSGAVGFTNLNATYFGQAGTAYTDSSTTQRDGFYWDPNTGDIRLITYAYNDTMRGTGLISNTATLSGKNTDISFVYNASGAVVGVYSTLTIPTASVGDSVSSTAFSGITGQLNYLFTYWDLVTNHKYLINRHYQSDNWTRTTLWKASGGGYISTLNGIGAIFKNDTISDSIVNYGNDGVAFTSSGATASGLIFWDLATQKNILINHSSLGNSDMAGSVAWAAHTSDLSGVYFTGSDASKFGNLATGSFTDAQAAVNDLFYWNKATQVIRLVSHSSTVGHTESITAVNVGVALQQGTNPVAVSPDNDGIVFYNNDTAASFGNNGTAFSDSNAATGYNLFYWDRTTGLQTLINHNSSGGASSTETTAPIFKWASDSSGLFFTTADVSTLGNTSTTFSDTGTSANDILFWNKSTSNLQLVTHDATSGNGSSSLTTSATLDAVMPNALGLIFGTNNIQGLGNNGVSFSDTGIGSKDLLFWDQATANIQLITHSSNSARTESSNTDSSVAFNAISASGEWVVFSANDATQFGNNSTAFLDSNGAASIDLFAWNASNGTLRHLTDGLTASATFNAISDDGNFVYYSTANVSGVKGINGNNFTDAGTAATDIVAVRLNLLDLLTSYDDGTSNYDNTTSFHNYDLLGYVQPNQVVQLQDNKQYQRGFASDSQQFRRCHFPYFQC